MDGTQITFGVILLSVLTGLGVGARKAWVFFSQDAWPVLRGWGERAVSSVEKTHNELTTSSRLNTETLISLRSQQENIWSPVCNLIKAEIKSRDITDESKEELLSHVEQVEQGIRKE